MGGAPKCCESWLALDVSLSVASGTKALGTYAVPRPGPVLVFAAEDPPATVRARLDGLAGLRGLHLDRLPLHIILSPSLRLDMTGDQVRLRKTIAQHRPRLLVLDPFVRLHRIDENSALEVSGVLAFLRDLQREHHVAILVVHHARKAAAASDQAGLSLRGSGDFHAWGDSNLYVRRRRGSLELAIEHRSAPTPDPVQLSLVTPEGEPPRLEVASGPAVARDHDLKQRIVQALATNARMTREALRAHLQIRTERLAAALRELDGEGRLVRSGSGWLVAPGAAHDIPGETESGSAGTQPDEG